MYIYISYADGELLLDVVFGRQPGNTSEDLKCSFTARNLPNKYTHKRIEKCPSTRKLTMLFVVIRKNTEVI